MQLNRKTLVMRVLILCFLGFFVGQGCRSRVLMDPSPIPFPSSNSISSNPSLLGYTIQTGAFTLADNAIRMTAALNKQGCDAFYFVHESGLFKVRMGNFSSRRKADLRAAKLLSKNIITDYYIVPPRVYSLRGIQAKDERSIRKRLVYDASNFISYPYTWGGSSPEEGFDCSGLALAVYHLNGLSLPRTSGEQYKSGKLIHKNRIQMGDLVFFKTVAGRAVSHVGIYAGNNSFIHAPGRNKTIRMDSLSNSYYKESFVGARSYF